MFENFAVPQIPYGGYSRTLADYLTAFPAGISSSSSWQGDEASRRDMEQASRIGEDVYRAYGTETGRDENFPHYAGRAI